MQQGDLQDLRVYRAENAAVLAANDPRPRVVLIGDSVTFHWEAKDRPAPASLNVLNRGIVGQNSDQMLLRFEDDVVALNPAAVVISAGANDARVFVGPPAAARDTVIARIMRNVTAMSDIAASRKIAVVIAAITPCQNCDAVGRDPATLVAANDRLHQFATARGYAFVDYYGALAGSDEQLAIVLKKDGLHPTVDGYARMWAKLAPILEGIGRKKR
jgi:acyl-CoA thioesterase I